MTDLSARYHWARRQLVHELNIVPTDDDLNAVVFADVNVPINKLIEEHTGYPTPTVVTSWKTFCPFFEEHADGGRDQNFRLYPPTNTACCFGLHGLLTPIKIESHAHGLNALEAAQSLCNRYGIKYKFTWQDRLDTLRDEIDQQLSHGPLEPDLMGILKVRIEDDPAYREAQFAPSVLTLLEAALSPIGTEAFDLTKPLEILRWATGWSNAILVEARLVFSKDPSHAI